jgi:hypothetical protein
MYRLPARIELTSRQVCYHWVSLNTRANQQEIREEKLPRVLKRIAFATCRPENMRGTSYILQAGDERFA